jgi:very-short-patch-repair endonuclease
MPQSQLEAAFELQLRAHGIEGYEREYRFHSTRRWRFDFAWIDRMLAVELNGGTWVRGRHNRGSSVQGDYEKLNAAQLLGWRVLQFTAAQVDDLTALATVQEALKGEGDE